MSGNRGFTLVELLVVITLIIVLLSILTPAMDAAVYQAELVACASKLKAIAGVMNTYALGYRREYPRNAYHAESRGGWHPPLLTHRGGAASVMGEQLVTGLPHDQRPLFRPYCDVNKTFTDPMLPMHEIDSATPNLVYGSYSLWNGWHWLAGTYKTTRRQARVGDRFDWKGSTGNGVERAWDILAGDFMRANLSGAAEGSAPDAPFWTPHPTKTGHASVVAVHSEPQTGQYSGIYTFWVSTTPVARDPVDCSFAKQDGSVQTLRDLGWDDERLIDVHEYNHSAGGNYYWHQMPRP